MILASIGDISDFEYVTQLFSHIEQRFHGVDVLVNNAWDLICRSAN